MLAMLSARQGIAVSFIHFPNLATLLVMLPCLFRQAHVSNMQEQPIHDYGCRQK